MHISPIYYIIYMSLICAVHCSYAHGCGAIQWSMVHLPAAIHLRKIDSHILKAINYQQLLSWGWRLGRPSPTPCWIWMVTGLLLFSSSTGNHSCYELMSTAILPFPEDKVCLRSFLTSGYHTLWTPSSRMAPEPWEEGCDRDVLSVAEHNAGTRPLHLDQSISCCSSHLPFPERSQQRLPWRIRIHTALGRECDPPQIDSTDREAKHTGNCGKTHGCITALSLQTAERSPFPKSWFTT